MLSLTSGLCKGMRIQNRNLLFDQQKRTISRVVMINGLYHTFTKEHVQKLASQFGELYSVHMLPSNSFPTSLCIIRFKELGSAIKMVDALDETFVFDKRRAVSFCKMSRTEINDLIGTANRMELRSINAKKNVNKVTTEQQVKQ